MHDNVSLSLRACGVGVDAVCAWLPARLSEARQDVM